MSLFDVAGHVGYVALPAVVAAESAGVPVPGETTLVASAVLAAQGHMQIGFVVALAALGAIAGDNLGYVLGRRLGRPALSPTAPGGAFGDERWMRLRRCSPATAAPRC